MANIMLTTSYKQISSFALTYGTIKTYAKYNSQSVENNQTSVTLQSRFTMASGWTSYSFDSATAKLDGTTKSYTSRTTFSSGTTTIQTKTITLNHNTDGSSPVKSVATSWTASFGGSGSASANIVVPKIDRYPLLTSADNFTDEGNPSVQYSTILGFSGASVSVGIFDANNNALASYREVNVGNGAYTFNLTTAERTALRNATPNSNNLSVIFKLKTTASGTDYISQATRTMTIVNANPTYTKTKAETNSKVITLIGSSSANTIIQNASIVHIVVTPTAQKGASISSVSITHNNITQTKTSSPYEFDINVVTNNIVIDVADSRSNHITETITGNMLSYTPMNIEGLTMKRVNPTSSNIQVTMTSPYQAQIGSYTNSLYLGYKLSGASSYTQIPSSKYTISGNTLSMNNSVLENVLSYQTKDNVELVVRDVLIEDTESRTIPKGIATFEYGATDLQVNGDLFIANTDRQNPVNVLQAINTPKPKARYIWNGYEGTQQSSTTAANVTNFSTTLTTYGGDIFVSVSAPFYQSNGTGNMHVYVDNVDKATIIRTNSKSNIQVHGETIITGISAGSHSFRVTMQPQNSSYTCYIGTYVEKVFTIIEL